jgi:predicted ATPase
MIPRETRTARNKSLRDLVHERFRLLEPRVREIVGCAALLGYRPDVAVLVACCGATPDVAIDALERACDLELVVAESRPPARYRFRHALTQAAIREALGAQGELELHARIASALEGLSDAGSRVEQLAFHWYSAGDMVKAQIYNLRAAREAMRLGAEDDAARFLERAHGRRTR